MDIFGVDLIFILLVILLFCALRYGNNMVKVVLTGIAVALMLFIQLYIGWPDVLENAPNFTPCKWYHFDIAEWTLHVDNVSCNLGPTAKTFDDVPKTFLKGKVIKEIQHANGTIENRGCTKYTQKCTEGPSFNEKLNKRINVPPCCRRNVLETLRHITTELHFLNVTYFLTYGNLIGWWRSRKMIPNDHDYDLLVDTNFYHSPKFDLFLKSMRTKYGHHTVIAESFRKGKKTIKMKTWIFQSKLNRNGGDLWPFEIVNRYGKKTVLVSKYNYASKDQPYENVFPLKKTTFHGFPVYVPNKVKAYLAVQYGVKGYQKELTCKKMNDFNCVT